MTETILKANPIGNKLCDRMYEKKWNVARLSIESHVPRCVIYKVFKGEGITVTTLAKVCQALGLEITVTETTNN